jgi:menaquinone-9 beta-reductase
MVVGMAQTMISTGTLTLACAIGRDWDAVVIGAGPGGALAARQLVLAGLRTLLVERHKFPRPKVCGGCLNGRALEVLRTVGLDCALSALRPVALNRFVLQANGRRLELDLPAGAAIQRSRFDAMLVQAAIDAGAEFLSEAVALVENDDRTDPAIRRVQLRQHGGLPRTLQAKVIVAADGLGHPSLQRIPAFGCQVEAASRVGMGTTIRGAASGYCSNTIYMAVTEWGYVGLVQIGDDTWNLAAALDPKVLKQAPGPAAIVIQSVREAGLPKLPTLDSCAWHGTPPMARQSARLAVARVFLLGDAAGYQEPFTGEGMGWALSSAVAVVPAAIQSVAGESELAAARWEATQRRQLRRGQTICRIVSGVLRRPALVGAGLHALSVLPSLANPLVRRVFARPVKVSHP